MIFTQRCLAGDILSYTYTSETGRCTVQKRQVWFVKSVDPTISYNVFDGVIINVLDCQLRDPGSNPARGETWFVIYAPAAPLANSIVMSTPTVHCQWEDETVRERIDHPHMSRLKN